MHSQFFLRVCAILVALLPLGRASAQSEPQIPQGRAGDAARAYLAAINTSDSTKIRAWLVKYDPEGDMTVRTGRQLSVARRTGGFTIERIMRAEPDAIEAVLRERKSGERVRLILVLDATGVAEGFGLEPMSAGSGLGRPPAAEPARGGQGGTPTGANGPTKISETELVRRLRALADSLQTAGLFSGVISLTKKGAPVFEQAYGNANRELRTPNTLETAFNLGSINKLFTATAIRQLAAAGRLALDSTLARAWPEYPNKNVARQVTVRQILEHRSGIMGDIFKVAGVADPGELLHNRQFMVGFVNQPLRFPPGSRENYSNAGYVVLGGVIERVSGEDYYEYVQRHIVEPAGMTRTGHFKKASLPAGTALGYTRGMENAPANAPLRGNFKSLPGRGSAAGGGYSTIGDLKKLLSALRAGTIPGAPPAGIGVAGGTDGVNAIVEGDLAGGYDLIVLANLDPPAAERIARRVRGWLGVD